MHWFILASQKEARIFIKTSERKRLKLLKSLTNPLGTEKRRALVKKHAGRGVKSIGRIGSVSYSMPNRHDPHEQALIQFARELAQFLKSEKFKRNFESLTVVAEPHFLGKIKAEMRADLRKSVTKWIKKDLQKTPQKDLVGFLLPKVGSAT